MQHDAAFIQAILAARHDDGPRLLYADWLEEKGDSLRAEYLRLQCRLVRAWSYENQQPDLFARLTELRPQIDPDWLAVVRRCTTPAPPVDVANAVPELKKRAKTAVRLHPRRGTAAADASKIGGLFLWPKGEEWPTCTEHDCPFVTVLQLRKEDVPEAGFRRGTDLFQVLWCPNDHAEGCPAPKLYWRKRARVKDPLASHPTPSLVSDSYVCRPCVLCPERVTEFPDPFEFAYGGETYEKIRTSEQICKAVDAAIKVRVARWESPGEPGRLYQCWLSTADGAKVGGYPAWVQDPAYLECSCGARMEPLLLFSSWEFDGATWGRWLAVEDREALTADYEARKAVQSAAGWMFGDAGCMYVFICRTCKDWPIRYSMQCS